MLYILYALFFIACITLIGSVLLQPGKTDAGALFTSNVSSSAFGPRGTASVLSKMTIIAATVFMLTALLISMPALQGGVSVLQSTAETPVEAPAETNTNAVTDANSAPATDTGSAPAADANTASAANTETPGNTETPANK